MKYWPREPLYRYCHSDGESPCYHEKVKPLLSTRITPLAEIFSQLSVSQGGRPTTGAGRYGMHGDKSSRASWVAILPVCTLCSGTLKLSHLPSAPSLRIPEGPGVQLGRGWLSGSAFQCLLVYGNTGGWHHGLPHAECLGALSAWGPSSGTMFTTGMEISREEIFDKARPSQVGQVRPSQVLMLHAVEQGCRRPFFEVCRVRARESVACLALGAYA